MLSCTVILCESVLKRIQKNLNFHKIFREQLYFFFTDTQKLLGNFLTELNHPHLMPAAIK